MILKRLGSIKFTIVLLVLLILASILGTLIPQDWSEMQYIEKYGDTYVLMKSLQLTSVYHSYWYSALLAIFCINLIICSTNSFEPLMKSLESSNSTIAGVDISSLSFYKRLLLKDTLENYKIIQNIKNTLKSSFYKLKYEDRENGICYFERGKSSRLGPLITHASIIIILIGGIVVGRLGFIEYRNVTVGKTIDVPHSNFQIRADDFNVEFYPSGEPKSYESILTVIENETPKRTETIKVNYPMKYKGIKFFQSSYGMTDAIQVELWKKSDAELLGKFQIASGEELHIPDTDFKLKALVILPDFFRDSNGQIGTRSMAPNNPAAFLELYEGDELKIRTWTFLKFPDFHASGDSDYLLKFASIVYFTGLQISRDPGISIIWIGSLLMLIGMFLSFYLSYKRIWIKFSSDSLEIGGRSYKDRTSFEKEFEKLKALL